MIVWIILLFVLLALASGKVRPDLAALCGLALLGILGKSHGQELFYGFSHPAVITIAAETVVAGAVARTGMISGLGKAIQRRTGSVRSQVMTIALVAGLLSTLTSAISTVTVLSPRARRMAGRAGVPTSSFVLPLLFAVILGSTVTLIGTNVNILVSTFRYTLTGRYFRMFDFSPQGLAMCAAGIALWLLSGSKPVTSRLPGKSVGDGVATPDTIPPEVLDGTQEVVGLFATLERRKTFWIVGGCFLLIALEILSPPVGFLTAGILLVFTNALSARQALELLDVPVVLFVGSMVSIARVLETNGQMDVVSRVVSAISIGVPGPAMVAGVIVVSCILANLLNNSASVVLMAPLVVRLASSGGTPATSDALLMAVAAGASLATVLPTHQAVVTAVSRGDITPREFIRAGSVLTLAAVAVAAAVVSVVWM